MTCLAAPSVVLSGADGQLRPAGAQGVFVADLRVLSEAVVLLDGIAAERVSWSQRSAGAAEFVSIARHLGDRGADPTVWLRRRRVAAVAGVAEHLTLVNRSSGALRTVVSIRVAADLVEMELVKSGRAGAPVDPVLVGGGVRYGTDRLGVDLDFAGASVSAERGAAVAEWAVTVPAGSEVELTWSLVVLDKDAVVVPASGPPSFTAPMVLADDRRLEPFVATSVADLQALRMSLAAHPDAEFVAAGSPWYFTLFGRDSIWSARMTLPLGTELAGGTLRTLAALQGSVVDPRTEEQPGKILHELRRSATTLAHGILPPVYYGTVDATPLWVCLLADAWRWGLPADAVVALLPAMERALEWIARYGDADGDGFLDYHDEYGRGLANQGWKDSDDSIRFSDGTIAIGPVALAEVQGYAFEAALAGATLLDAFARPGAERWRRYARELADRFRAAFWVSDTHGRFPALALDGAKRPVDSPASNMGHLLGTGMLTADEERAVADRLVHPSMSSGFGLRTMASTVGGYSPLSYHCGSVWPHDTAIAVHGLVRAGLVAHAAELARGLLAAGTAFSGRLPELFGGFSADDLPAPVPYPASCRPQAWAAAAAIVMVQGFLGLDPDVPHGIVRFRPSSAVGALQVAGLRVAGAPLSVTVDGTGAITAVSAAEGLLVQMGSP